MSNVALFALGGVGHAPRWRCSSPPVWGRSWTAATTRSGAQALRLAEPEAVRAIYRRRRHAVLRVAAGAGGAIRSGGVLDALRAAAELRRLPAARVDPRPLLRAAAGSGDALARAALGYALDVDRRLRSTGRCSRCCRTTSRPCARSPALTLAHRRPWVARALGPASRWPGRGLRRHARRARARGVVAWTSREAPVCGLRGPRFESGLRVAQVVLQGRLDAGLREPGRGTAAVSPRSSSTSRGRSAAVPRSTTS